MLDEWNEILREATAQTEQLLGLEDQGWINLSSGGDVITAASRKTTVTEARLYGLKDPLCKRAVALMTDYSFGHGVTWNAENKKASQILGDFWYAPENKPLFSAKGQRKSSDKLLIDGELFLAVFLGEKTTIRRIDPLEITELISDPDDLENMRFYKREWNDTQGKPHVDYYRSFSNLKNEACVDSLGASHQSTQDALVYHLAINDLGQRGNSYLLPALEWVKLYRKFLASRVAVMLALARFAWKAKVTGGSAATTAVKSVFHEQETKSGSTIVENQGVDMQPIRTDSGASQAYQDGRQLKLQVCSAIGFPEQYLGDVSIGSLATAQTTELPVLKMIQSYQAIWKGAYEDVFDLVCEQNNIPEDNRYVDFDFPNITPEDAGEIAKNISALGMIMPELLSDRDVIQQALMSIGIEDTQEVLDRLDKIAKESQGDVNVKLAKALRDFREVMNGKARS